VSNELVPMGDLEKMAAAIAKSGLFGAKTPEQALALMLVAQSEGLHPMAAVQQFDIIQGRPARKAASMLERFQAAGGKVVWHERTDAKVSAQFSHPQGGSVEVEWDMARANKAGLGGKDNWKKFPRQMLSARVISEGVRTVYPGATGGFYEPGEVTDFEPDKPARKTQRVEVINAETGEVTEQRVPVAKAADPHEPTPDANNPFGFPADAGELGPREPELPAQKSEEDIRAEHEASGNHVLTRIKELPTKEDVAKYVNRYKPTINQLPKDIADIIWRAASERIEGKPA
jgi:hypothetical protein